MQTRLKKSLSKHHIQQMDYFEDEFKRLSTFSIEPWQASYFDRLIADMYKKPYKSKRLLDIATGTGYIAVHAAQLGMRVTACDLSSTAITNLRRLKRKENITGLEIVKCYAEKIPLKDKTFDYIVANAILEHIPAETEALAEWKRLLKPGGKIMITVPLQFQYIWPFFWPVNYIHDRRIGHLRRYDAQILEKKLGMKITHVYYTGHFWKVIAAILGFVFRSDVINERIEDYDRRRDRIRYGASNISIIAVKAS